MTSTFEGKSSRGEIDDYAIYRSSQKLGILRVMMARERRNEMKEKGLGQKSTLEHLIAFFDKNSAYSYRALFATSARRKRAPTVDRKRSNWLLLLVSEAKERGEERISCEFRYFAAKFDSSTFSKAVT